VQFWELGSLDVEAHHPQVLRSDDDANRVIALLLPEGESLQEHQVHEHALVGSMPRAAARPRAAEPAPDRLEPGLSARAAFV
jgi:hypothetical protein